MLYSAIYNFDTRLLFSLAVITRVSCLEQNLITQQDKY